MRRLILISLFSFSFAYGQQDTSCIKSLFIDRPLVKCDSQVILTNHISTIKLYYRLVDDSIPNKIYLGKWVIVIKENKIKSTSWVVGLIPNSTMLYGCDTRTKLETKKNSIIETTGDSKDGFQFTHLLNKYGQIYTTEIKHIGKLRFETRYAFKKIDYKYDGDFLVESNYFFTGIIDEKYDPLLRLFFEYEK